MKLQERSWLHPPRGPEQSARMHQERAEPHDAAFERSQMRSPARRAFDQQELLFEKEVFSDDGTDATWAKEFGNNNKTMHDKDEEAFHEYAIVAPVP